MIPEVIARWRPQAVAYRGSLEVDLVLAVIWQESTGNPWAYRYEPGYQYFYNANSKKALFDRTMSPADNRAYALKILGATELVQQSASWGLMQVMGAVAREHGFIGFVSKLCDPNEGVKWGCKYLNMLYKSKNGDLRKALVRYNGGSAYPDEVFKKLESIREG